MNAFKVMSLIDKYGECPECGSSWISNGEGTLEVTDDTFIRTCKCGWQVQVKDGDDE